jgi:hypothetical protein
MSAIAWFMAEPRQQWAVASAHHEEKTDRLPPDTAQKANLP